MYVDETSVVTYGYTVAFGIGQFGRVGICKTLALSPVSLKKPIPL
jgi:hypothetical protein